MKNKKPKVRPEFTFEDGFHFNFYLGRRKCYSGLDNYKLFYQISGYSIGVLDKDRICYVIKMVQQALEQSSEICSTWEHKSLRKKLKLYIKWLQSEMSRQEPSKQGLYQR